MNLEEHFSEKTQMKLILLNPSLHKEQLLQKNGYDTKEGELDSEDYFSGDHILILSKIILYIYFFNKSYGISNRIKNLST